MARLLITGANGYVGHYLVRAALAAGIEVVGAVRRPEGRPSAPGLRWARFDLADSEADHLGLLQGVDAVVHLAAVLQHDRLGAESQDPNVRGTRALLEASRASGVRRFVFVSSQSAAQDSPTRYGRSKWAIEQMLEPRSEIVVRLGLVSGGAALGVYGQLLRLIRGASVLPLIRPDAPIYPIHVQDVARGLLCATEGGSPPTRPVWLGAVAPTRFADYLRRLAQARLGRRLRLLPLPAWVALAGMRVVAWVPGLSRPDPERVRGLMALRPVDTEAFACASELGFELRDPLSALSEEGRRRRLLVEGRALVAYVTSDRAEHGVVRRYVRGVEAEPDPAPLDLPRILEVHPGLLRAFEPTGERAPRLRRRLRIATSIAEMTPGGARRFHRYQARSRLGAWFSLGRTAMVEAVLLVLRSVLGRIL